MNGMKHGRGKWIKNNNLYEGEYYMDRKQGYGEFRWASGNVYKGNYKIDLRNGYGEMYWTDGSIYKGNWVNGIQHGYGKMMFIDGTLNEGIFDHNIYQGPMNVMGVHPAAIIHEDPDENEIFNQPRLDSLPNSLKQTIHSSKSPIMQSNKIDDDNQFYPQIDEKNLFEKVNDTNKKFFIPPQIKKQKKPKRLKPKPEIDSAAEEDIQEIMKIVRAQKSQYVKKASRTKNKTIRNKSKSKSKKRNTSSSATRKKAKTIIKRRKSSLDSNHMPDISRKKKHISIDSSSGSSNLNKMEVSKIAPDVQTPDSSIDNKIDHSQIKSLTNVSLFPKKIKKK